MAIQKMSSQAILVLVVTGIVATVLASMFVSALLAANQRIPNTGNVKAVGVGVYWDSDCTNNVTSIDWNIVELGKTANRTVYIENGGNTRIILNMTTSNWSVGALGKITLSWDRESYLLDSGSVISTVFTLSVSSDTTVSSFSFDITITGTEYA